MDMDLGTDSMEDTEDTMDMVSMVDMVFGDVRRGRLKPNLLPNLPPKPLLNLVTSMAMDMDLDMDTMADTTDLDIVVTMDTDIFGDVRRGKLKPNPLPNLPQIPTSTTDMAMDSATIGENKSQIHQAHYQHSASKCLDGNNDDLSFCCVCGVWCVVCGVWCVVCGVWCVVCCVWCVELGDM